MKGSKYLSQIIKERNIEIKGNTLIISPCGSGKTYYILNELCKGKKCLYLCDTNNLKYQVNKSLVDIAEEMKEVPNVTVMSYAKFGIDVKFTNEELINQYDLIIADEVHNLIDYQTFSTNTDNLAIATEYLLKEYEHTDIVFFTATPKYLNILVKKYPHADNHFNCIDLSYDEEILSYTENMKAYINHYTSIYLWLTRYYGYFHHNNGKCLMYTSYIENMKILEDICKEKGLNPICIWSLNNEENPMTQEQRDVREYLLNTGKLKEPYNVLIINRATETGVNIVDENMKLAIINTTNETQQVQARNRIRHDIDLLVLKTNDTSKLEFSIDKEILGQWLTKEEVIERVIRKNNMRNKDGREVGIRLLPKLLEKKGYLIESKKVRDKEYYIKTKKSRNITMYKIENKK